MREIIVQLLIDLPEDFIGFQGFGVSTLNAQLQRIYAPYKEVYIMDYFDRNQRVALLTLKCSFDISGKLYFKSSEENDLLTICKKFLTAGNFNKVILYIDEQMELGHGVESCSRYICYDATSRNAAIKMMLLLLPKPEYTSLEPRRYSRPFELLTYAYNSVPEMALPITIGIAAGITLEAIYKLKSPRMKS